MVRVKRTLISVSDKTGILEFVQGLHKLGVEVISTGGTAKLLREASLPATEVSRYTGFPEMLDGRVKTLHPRIHAGILALRDNPEHMQSLKKHKIGLIDMVVVNLYPFQKTIRKRQVSLEEAIENIDIGGPSMLRSAAKNFRQVAVVCNPSRYPQILEELRNNHGLLSDTLLKTLAVEVFELTSGYDSAIYEFLKGRLLTAPLSLVGFPEKMDLEVLKVQDLRYGENPHQRAAFYRLREACEGVAGLSQLHGKELSFNNILDLDSALGIVKEFSGPAAAIIKHNNPCGVASAKTLLDAFRAAWRCDELSAFGSIVGLNQKVDPDTAKAISDAGFTECVLAPAWDSRALALLKKKKNVRLLEVPFAPLSADKYDLKKVSGGILLQERDEAGISRDSLRVVTKKKPTETQLASLLFAEKVAKHVKSNAIVLVKGTETVGIGAGQMSRVDSVFIAVKKAGRKAVGSVMASDAFFPKTDAVRLAAQAQVKAIIQPGGSVADEEVIKTADRLGLIMVFTGMRHFRH